jgi:hypothetical protein
MRLFFVQFFSVRRYAAFQQFALEGITPYLSSTHLGLRKAACLACSQLLIPPRGELLDKSFIARSFSGYTNALAAVTVATSVAANVPFLSWDDVCSASEFAPNKAHAELGSISATASVAMPLGLTSSEIAVVRDTLRVLLQRGVADLSPEIRVTVAVSLSDPFFTPFLCDLPLIRRMFSLLHDPLLEVLLSPCLNKNVSRAQLFSFHCRCAWWPSTPSAASFEL